VTHRGGDTPDAS